MLSKRKSVRKKSHLKQNLIRSKTWFQQSDNTFVKGSWTLDLNAGGWCLQNYNGAVIKGNYGVDAMSDINKFS